MSAIGLTAIMALHYIPWGKLFGGELSPPWTYVAGVTVIGTTFTIWSIWARPTWGWAIGGFWAITAATGIGDVLCYAFDSLGGLLMERRTLGRTQKRGIERN